ncbi:4-hydroxythreonine-4-phosphate dehydrogenase PdxA [Acidobacteriota bacterium]
MKSAKPLIAITMGDPAGIGPEIVMRTAADPGISALGSIAVYGDKRILSQTKAMLGLEVRLRRVAKPTRDPRYGKIVQVVESHGDVDLSTVKPGHTNAKCGKASVRFLEAATREALAARIDALVTAPVCKTALWEAGTRVEGQTQFLSTLCNVKKIGMVLIREPLRVMLLTRHMPLKTALNRVTKRRILEKIRLAHREFEKIGIPTPRIAVAGLNPHAGEAGLFGREEIREIAPAIAVARKEGIAVSGPAPADTVFQQGLAGQIDLVLALYHDQGMIPVKTLGFGNLVVWIAGLPIIRTSVGHGTAFNIAGQGVADHASLVAAFKMAVKMAKTCPWS